MSGADEKIRAVIERVAQECSETDADYNAIMPILRLRLLPLLLAGQAMRDGVIGASGGLKRIQLARAWDDAALAAAQGQPEKESGS